MKYMGQNNLKNDLTSVVTANFGGNCDVFWYYIYIVFAKFLIFHILRFCKFTT